VFGIKDGETFEVESKIHFLKDNSAANIGFCASVAVQ
jgi:hypothetical protein